MKNIFYDFTRVAFESPEERESKRQRLKALFSRVFLALFVYMLISQLLSTVIYTAAFVLMSAEEYAAFADSSVATVLVSCVSQYAIALPVLVLMLRNTDKAAPRTKDKLTAKDFFLLLLAGEALMFAGNLVGTMLNNVFGAFRGSVPENDVAEIVSEVPIYLIFIVMVVIGPIVEELIFRKLMIDRLSIYGDRMAILFSAVAFGLIHANLYQFFYATLLGILLGYVYTRTGNVKYTMLLHMVINFMGSIMVLPVQSAMTEFYRLLDLVYAGEPFNPISLSLNGLIVFVYSNLQYGMVIGGGYVLYNMFKTGKIRISGDKEIFVTNGDILRNGVNNVGAILFVAFSLLLMLINLFLS